MLTSIEELREWLAQKQGDRINVHRASRGHGLGRCVAAVSGEGDHAATLLAKLREETEDARRASCDFVLVDRDAKGTEMRERAIFRVHRAGTLDDDDKPTLEAFASQLVLAIDRKDAHLLEQSKIVTGALTNALDKLGARLSEHEKASGEVLARMLDLSKLQLEREQAAQAATERRVMIATAAQEFGPIAAAVAGKALGIGPDKQLDALVRSMTPDQITVFSKALKPEQLVLLQGILEARAKAEAAALEKANPQTNGAAS